MCRLTIDGERTEFSTNQQATNITWNQDKQRLKGANDEAYLVNKSLDLLRHQINEIIHDFRKSGTPITGPAVKYELGGGVKRDDKYTILNLYNEEIANYGTSSTKLSKKSSVNAMEEFLQTTFSTTEFFIFKVDYSFIKKFEAWGLNTKKWKVNSLIVQLDLLRKICTRCFREGIIKKDPFTGFSIKREKRKERFLDPKDVTKMIDAKFDFEPFNDPKIPDIKHTPEKCDLTRKVFIFITFIGSAWVDGRKLDKTNLVIEPDGSWALSFKRQKTKVNAYIPLLDYAKELLIELMKHPKAIRKGRLLPMEALSVYNRRLRVIQEYCGIEKDITSHVARHIAGTFYLNAGISQEITAQALGLTVEELRKTYGKILTDSVSRDFKALNDKLNAKKL